MITARTALARRVTAALDAVPSRIPVLLGGCGSGRTTLLQQLRERLGRTSTQYIDVERIASTPERMLHAVVATTPFPPIAPQSQSSARAAFDATLDFLTRIERPGGGPATFLLDEFLELRTFESFPGLRRVLHDTIEALAASGNRFVLTSRYAARSLRLLRDHSSRFEVIHMPPLTAEDTQDILGPISADGEPYDVELLARTVRGLSEGRPSYVAALADELAANHGPGTAAGRVDAVTALVSLLAPHGRLAKECGSCYELRLHRARGYGALKAILEILGEQEGLTLTEISHRLQRTPGSTKDYLSWLEDVDLVTSQQKKYTFTDPLLRVWVRLHCQAAVPTEDDVVREVHKYGGTRIPAQSERPAEPAPPPAEKEPAFAMAGGPSSGIIEID